MTNKALDQLRKLVPELNSPLGILRFFLLSILVFILVTFISNTTHSFWPFWQLVAQILLGSLGFGFLYLFFQSRLDFKARFGPLAYSRAAKLLGLPGVTIIAIVIAHLRSLPGSGINLYGWNILHPIFGWVLVVLGTVLGLRTVQVLGIDNLIMLYVYFPEESRLVDHKIYDILRHPAYAAVQMIAFGLALLDGKWTALAGALIFSLALWGWVYLVEEKELIQRFGPNYAEYRKRVPAFWPRLHDLRGFISFLILGN